MSNWTEGEKGPLCFCGNPTGVVADGAMFSLLCFLHEREVAAVFPLPSERPESWPNMTDAEMVKLVERGEVEHRSAEETGT